MSEGKTTIAPEVLISIARLTSLNVEGVSRLCLEPTPVGRIFRRSVKEGVRVEVINNSVFADLYVVLHSGVNIRDVSRNIQHQVARAISEMVGMQVGQVNIHIEDIEYPQESEA